jgi:membrane-associated phospholipid phosphatase
MANNRLTFHLRLEDLVALTFFLLTLLLRLFFRGFERHNLSPADVLIIIPAVALLLGKELANYFISGKEKTFGQGVGPLEFIRPYWRILRDWFPFLVILLMYYSLWGDATLLLVAHDRDAALISLDQRIFGFQASVAMQRFITPGLTSWMDFAYFFHILNIPIVACYVYIRSERKRFREMMSGLMVVSFFGLLGYLLVPAIGPLYTLRDVYTVPLRQSLSVFNHQVEFMNFARIQRDVFPSLHVGISFVVWLYAYRNSKRLFWILSPFIISLWISTVYLRYHYLVDVVAGLILAPLCYWLANWMFKRFGEIPFTVVVPAAWATRFSWLGTPQPATEAAEKAEEKP